MIKSALENKFYLLFILFIMFDFNTLHEFILSRKGLFKEIGELFYLCLCLFYIKLIDSYLLLLLFLLILFYFNFIYSYILLVNDYIYFVYFLYSNSFLIELN
jgi:hypothetical protein